MLKCWYQKSSTINLGTYLLAHPFLVAPFAPDNNNNYKQKTLEVGSERFHLLLFSIKESIFPIHMIGKFCYKEDKRWVLTYFINRKFQYFDRKFHVFDRKFHVFNSKFHVFDNKFHVFDSKFWNFYSNSDAIDAKYH